jgi:hypothetical protein
MVRLVIVWLGVAATILLTSAGYAYSAELEMKII